MTINNKRTHWPIRRLLWFQHIVVSLFFPATLVAFWLSPHEPKVPYVENAIPVGFGAFSLLGPYALLRETCVGVDISHEGIALKYLLRTDIVPMAAIREVFYGSVPTLLRGEGRVVCIDVQGRSSYLRLRENDFVCEPGEIERAMQAFCSEKVVTKTLKLADLIGPSDERDAAGQESPTESAASTHRYHHTRCRPDILAKTIALLIFAGFVWAFTYLPDPRGVLRLLGAGISSAGALWFAWSICFREMRRAELSGEGVRLWYLLRSRFIPRQDITSVRVQVSPMSARPWWPHVWLRTRRASRSIHLWDREDTDLIRAIAEHYSQVAEVIDAVRRSRKSLERRGRACDGTQIAH